MWTPSRPVRWTPPLMASLLALAAPLTLVAQEPEDERERIEDLLGPQDPLQQEMIQLFGEVERSLVAIDDLLFEAASGENDLDLMESGLSELFLETRDRSGEVAEGIDRILELAQEMESQQQQQQQSSSGGSSSSQGQGESPLDNRGQESSRRKEDSQTEPGAPESGQGEQGENRQNNGPEERDPSGNPRPQDGEPTEEPGTNGEGDQPGSDPLGAGSDPSGVGQWGELPPRVQEIFSNQVSDELPLEYRDFIESYWLRLQREE